MCSLTHILSQIRLSCVFSFIAGFLLNLLIAHKHFPIPIEFFPYCDPQGQGGIHSYGYAIFSHSIILLDSHQPPDKLPFLVSFAPKNLLPGIIQVRIIAHVRSQPCQPASPPACPPANYPSILFSTLSSYHPSNETFLTFCRRFEIAFGGCTQGRGPR